MTNGATIIQNKHSIIKSTMLKNAFIQSFVLSGFVGYASSDHVYTMFSILFIAVNIKIYGQFILITFFHKVRQSNLDCRQCADNTRQPISL